MGALTHVIRIGKELGDMVPDFFTQRRPHAGLTYSAYLERLAEAAREADSVTGDVVAIERAAATKLNLKRSERIAKIYGVSAPLAEALAAIDAPQLWMVLTEPWCGDSAQCLPYIAKMAALSPKIDLRILLRDQNLAIMDRYLTNGGRAIPKLVAYSADGEELFQWGPRPAEAAEIHHAGKAAGIEKTQLLEKLHLWYGRDRGKTIDAEFVKILSQRSKTP